MGRAVTKNREQTRKLGLGVGQRLMQPGPRVTGMVYLPTVHFQALLLQLEQHLVPFRIVFADLVPNVLPANSRETQLHEIPTAC